MFKKTMTALALSSMMALTACSAPGYEDRPDVYSANMVNQAQQIGTIYITMLRPVKIQVSNARNQRGSSLLGGLLGAGLGVGMGLGVAHSGLAAGLGGLGGGVAGGMIGNTISGSTTLTDGVTVVFKTIHGNYLSSTQVGRMCEYQYGPAVIVATGPGSVRIQPNSSCAQH